jgi:hypothetical protein
LWDHDLRQTSYGCGWVSRTTSVRKQLDVISAPPDEPLLVVAGAGSGKTELMALRVIWLVANGHVRADQVLGLTFTERRPASWRTVSGSISDGQANAGP